MKSINPLPAALLAKRFSPASLAWAGLVTAVVLTAAGSARAQTSTSTASTTPAAPAEIADAATSTAAESATTTPTDAPPPTAASTASDDGRYQSIRNEIEARRAALLKKSQELASSSQARPALSDATALKVTDDSGLLAAGLQQALQALQSANARLRIQAETLRAQGRDTAAAESALQESDSRLSLADDALEDVDINARYAARSATPLFDWVDVRAQYVLAGHILTDARDASLQAARALRAAAEPEVINP